MRFEEALTSLREGYHVRRKDWNIIALGWPPDAPGITAFWQAGFTEPYRPTVEDIQAEDWLLFPLSKAVETRRLHTVIDEACRKLGM